MTRSRANWLLVPPLLLALASCGPATTFTDVWVSPDAEPFQAQKVLAVFVSADSGMRRVGENELVRQIAQRTPAVASYTFLDQNQVRDVDYAKQQVQTRGFDGVVIMRLLNREVRPQESLGTMPNTPYPEVYETTWGFWSYAWPAVYDQGNAAPSESVQMETSIYSVQRDALVWVAHSETVDPATVTNLVRDVSEATREALQAQGLIPAK